MDVPLAHAVFFRVFRQLRLADHGAPSVWDGQRARDIWICFSGLYSVYRVICFTDIGSSFRELLYLSAFGLAFGRLGESAGAWAGYLLRYQEYILIMVTAILITAHLILLVQLDRKLYPSAMLPADHAPREPLPESPHLQQFADAFEFSFRERMVYELVMGSSSNGEISEELSISVRTVRFYVSLLLKKT